MSMSQSDSQYVIFITVGQRGIAEHLTALATSASTLNMTRIWHNNRGDPHQ
jgi:hypothetical protein